MSLRKVIAFVVPVSCLVVTGYAACPAEASGPSLVAPGHLSGWSVTTNEKVAPPYDAGNLNSQSTAAYEFAKGPGKPPLGDGSLMMSTGSEKNSRVSAVPPGLVGRTFGEVSELRFATYLENASSTGYTSPTNVKLAGTGTLGYATAVFEPRNQAAKPATGKWQAWNAASGVWWTSKVTSGSCSQAKPCSWKKMVGKIGASTKISTAYFELGDSGTSFSDEKCALDDVAINGVTYNFEAAAPPAPPTAVTPGGPAGPGGRVTVHGTGFQPGEQVRVTLHSTAVVVGTAAANGAGDVTLTFIVPAGTSPGQHVIVLLGLASGRTATVPLVVIGGPQTGFGGMARNVAHHHPRA